MLLLMYWRRSELKKHLLIKENIIRKVKKIEIFKSPNNLEAYSLELGLRSIKPFKALTDYEKMIGSLNNSWMKNPLTNYEKMIGSLNNSWMKNPLTNYEKMIGSLNNSWMKNSLTNYEKMIGSLNNSWMKNPLTNYEKMIGSLNNSWMKNPLTNYEKMIGSLNNSWMKNPLADYEKKNIVIDTQGFLENLNILNEVSNNRLNLVVEENSEDVKELFKIKQETYSIFRQNQWFLDETILEHIIFNEKKDLKNTSDDVVIDYLEKNFDEYVTSLLESKCYSSHKEIIKESIAAFKNNQFKLAIFPLFAIFDNVFSRWYLGEINDEPDYSNKFIKQLWVKMSKNVDMVRKNIEAGHILKAVHIINAFLNLFTSKPKDLTNLNRNAILHGSFNYSLLDKKSYLKMIVLLKTTIDLEDIPIEEIYTN